MWQKKKSFNFQVCLSFSVVWLVANKGTIEWDIYSTVKLLPYKIPGSKIYAVLSLSLFMYVYGYIGQDCCHP